MAVTVDVTKSLVGEEDISFGDGTFSRTTSTGGSQTMNKVRRTPRWVNVKDPTYGATGDGTTDDADAIIAAINAVYDKDRGDRSTMGNVYFPPGEYRSSKQIRVPAYVRLIGDGRSLSMLRATAAFDYANAASDGLSGKQAFVVLGDYDRDESNNQLTGTFTADNLTTVGAADATVTVSMTAHGLVDDDTFYIAAGSIGGPIDGIPASDFNDIEFAVTKVDADSFTIEVDTNATAGSVSGSSGDTVTWYATDGQIAFHAGCTGLTINADEANTDQNSVGVFSRRIQETGGLDGCNVGRWGFKALWLEDVGRSANLGANTCQNFKVRDSTFTLSALAAVGAAADPPAAVHIDGKSSDTRGLINCTMAAALGTITGGDAVTASLRLTQCKSGTFIDNNFEGHKYGVLVEDDCAHITIAGAEGESKTTDLIRIESGASNIACINIRKGTVTGECIYDANRASGDEAVDSTPLYIANPSGTTQTDDTEIAGNLTVTGRTRWVANPVTLAAAATDLDISGSSFVRVTGDAGGNTLATITGGSDDVMCFVYHEDALVTYDCGTIFRCDGNIDFTPQAQDLILLMTRDGKVNIARISSRFQIDRVLNASARGAATQIVLTEEQSAALSGATTTLSNFIPANAMVLGVTARVTTTITGATTWSMGISADDDKWGSGLALASGTTVNASDWTPQFSGQSIYIAGSSADDLVFTAAGSNFTGGVIRAAIHYIALTPPTS